MPERRSGAGRRKDEGKRAETGTHPSPEPTPAAEEQRPEVEPDRRHFLHKKIGGRRRAA
jgi:hypothetical protein